MKFHEGRGGEAEASSAVIKITATGKTMTTFTAAITPALQSNSVLGYTLIQNDFKKYPTDKKKIS